MNCKKCNNEMVFIGSNQNGFLWLCRKCNHLNYADEKEDPRRK